MPETLHQSEIDSKTDPSVSKQYDNETSTNQQIQDFYKIADGLKVGILNTYRNGVGAYQSYLEATRHELLQRVRGGG
jgi:hypothetical protein